MQTGKYHNGQRLAILAGTVATAGALAILLSDPISSGNWRLDHALLPVIVLITIASGHLVGSALRSRKWLSAIGFAAIFVLGTLLTVYSSVGSQKAASGDKALSVEAHNRAIGEKRGELATARQRLTVAENMIEQEARNKRCGQACNDWKARAAEVRSHVAVLEASLARLGGEKVARPKASAFAEMASVFGADRARVEHAAIVLEPFSFSLLLELTAIVCFGFGFGHAQGAGSASAPAQTEVDPKPRKRGRRGATERDPNAVKFVEAYRAKHGSDPAPRDLQAKFGMARTSARRYATANMATVTTLRAVG